MDAEKGQERGRKEAGKGRIEQERGKKEAENCINTRAPLVRPHYQCAEGTELEKGDLLPARPQADGAPGHPTSLATARIRYHTPRMCG